MPTISDIRQQYPQYKDLSDDQLAKGLHDKFYSDMPFEQFAQKIGYQADVPPNGNNDFAGAFFRPVIKAVTGIPSMAADSGIALRNLGESAAQKMGIADPIYALNRKLAGNSDVAASILPGGPGAPAEGLTPQFDRALEPAFPSPTGLPNKAAEFFNTALLGSKVPAPQASEQAPAGFMSAKQLLKNQTLQTAQKEGYVVPPSSNNPSAMNRLMEGIAGKAKLSQEAMMRNQGVTDTLASRALGANPDAPLTEGALNAIRDEAGQAYKNIQDVGGRFVADAKFRNTLSGLKGAYEDVAKDIPSLAKPQITEALDGLASVDSMSPKSALGAIRILRENADTAYSSGDKSLGAALKKAATAMEDLVERNLTRLHAKGQLEDLIKSGGLGTDDLAGQLLARAVDNPSSKLLQDFKDARELIAKTYTAGKALTDTVGTSNAASYANDLAKGVPLKGDQKLIGEFASRFGKFAQVPKEIYPSISPLDTYGAAVAAGATGSAAPLALPLSRVALREYLLSQGGQARAFPKTFSPQETLQYLGLLPAASGVLSGP